MLALRLYLCNYLFRYLAFIFDWSTLNLVERFLFFCIKRACEWFAFCDLNTLNVNMILKILLGTYSLPMAGDSEIRIPNFVYCAWMWKWGFAAVTGYRYAIDNNVVELKAAEKKTGGFLLRCACVWLRSQGVNTICESQ